MIKKIIHLADLHIRTFQYHDMYARQFELLFEDLNEKKKQWELQGLTKNNIRIVIAGDIAHQKINISNEQLLLTSQFISKLTEYGSLVIIPGNHDFLENNTQRIDSITPVVELLRNQNITYYKDMGVYRDENVDWVVYSLYQHNQRPKIEKGGDRFKVGIFHGPIQGMSTDLGFTFDDAYDKLNFIGLDLLLCGDIHKRQVFSLNNGGKAVMIGSLIQQNFGETVGNHGYGIFHFDTSEYTFHDIENETPFLSFSISDIKDIEDEAEILLNP